MLAVKIRSTPIDAEFSRLVDTCKTVTQLTTENTAANVYALKRGVIFWSLSEFCALHSSQRLSRLKLLDVEIVEIAVKTVPRHRVQ